MRKTPATAKTCCTEECKDNIEKTKSPTAGLRFHDLRHHAITELAESQARDQTIMAIAGHVAPRMLAHYSHVRLEAKRNALSCFGTDRTSTQAADQDPLRKEGGTTQIGTSGNGTFGTARKQW